MEAGTNTGRQPGHLRKNGNKKRQVSVRENWRAKNSHYYTELHGTIMPMQCYTCPEKEQCFFLTDVDHVSFEKANETRQNNLPSATVSLQVVIGLCRRKETAALKIKAAASNGRVDRLLYDGFFSFAVVRQLVPFAFILTSNPHRNVTDTRCFDRIMG